MRPHIQRQRRRRPQREVGVSKPGAEVHRAAGHGLQQIDRVAVLIVRITDPEQAAAGRRRRVHPALERKGVDQSNGFARRHEDVARPAGEKQTVSEAAAAPRCAANKRRSVAVARPVVCGTAGSFAKRVREGRHRRLRRSAKRPPDVARELIPAAAGDGGGYASRVVSLQRKRGYWSQRGRSGRRVVADARRDRDVGAVSELERGRRERRGIHSGAEGRGDGCGDDAERAAPGRDHRHDEGRRCVNRRLPVDGNFRRAESAAVDAHLVERSTEPLADLHRLGRRRERSVSRTACDFKALDINPQSRAVVRERNMRPRIQRQRDRREHRIVGVAEMRRRIERAGVRDREAVQKVSAIEIRVLTPQIAPRVRAGLRPRLEREGSRDARRVARGNLDVVLASIELDTASIHPRRPRRAMKQRAGIAVA